MNLADVFTVVLVILGLLILFVGLWLATAGLWPRLVDGCAERLGAAPIMSFLVGLVSAVPLVAVGIAVGKVAPNAPGKLLGVAIVVGVVLAALAGAAGLALRIGRGLGAERDVQEPWRRVLRGGIVLAITCLTVVLLPVILLAGLGALLLALMRRGKTSAGGVTGGE